MIFAEETIMAKYCGGRQRYGTSTDNGHPEEAGHEVIAASDGEEAEQKARAEAVDMVILDVIMPKKNGFPGMPGTCGKDDKLKDVPIIMVSSKNQESDRAWGLKQGATEYITKPFTPLDPLGSPSGGT